MPKDEIWLLWDANGNTVVENIVFGSYNSRYQILKYPASESDGKNINYYFKNINNIDNNETHSNFISLLHDIQHQTIDAKFKYIL